MNAENPSTEAGCPSGCPHCNAANACPTVRDASLSPLGMSIWAGIVFVVPLLAAAGGVVGMRQIWSHPANQFVGAVAGLAGGIVLVRLAVRWFGPAKTARQPGEFNTCVQKKQA